MTLTSLIPSLRRSLPDPLAADRWPTATAPTTTDVLVGGVSLQHLALLCGTPCVHTAAGVVPGTAGRLAATSITAVVVTAVVRGGVGPRGDLLVTVDATLARVSAVWAETRLIGRASTARAVDTHLQAPTSPVGQVHTVRLPSDLRVGDLLAVPCAGPVALRDLREDASDATVDTLATSGARV